MAPACGSPFFAVAHAVAIDAFYDTTPETILNAYHDAIVQLAGRGCATIAAACLGCGYGRLATPVFADIVRELFARNYTDVESVTLTTTNAELFAAIKLILPATDSC